MTSESKHDLVKLLATASEDDQAAIAAWLADREGCGQLSWIPASDIVGQLSERSQSRPEEGSQLLKFRLATSRYDALQSWCADNGLTMAGALRGLVELLLENAERYRPSRTKNDLPGK